MGVGEPGEERAAEAAEHRARGPAGAESLAIAGHEGLVQLLGEALQVGQESGARGPVCQGVGAVEEVRVDFLEDGDLRAAVGVEQLGVGITSS